MEAFNSVNHHKSQAILKINEAFPLISQKLFKVCTETQINGSIQESMKFIATKGCNLPAILFTLHLDDIRQWKFEGQKLYLAQDKESTLFANDQVLLAESENELQCSLYSLNMVIQDYNLQISTKKPEVMAFYGKQPITSNIIMNNQPTEQVSSFMLLGCK
jgi:hypothetical protein